MNILSSSIYPIQVWPLSYAFISWKQRVWTFILSLIFLDSWLMNSITQIWIALGLKPWHIIINSWQG